MTFSVKDQEVHADGIVVKLEGSDKAILCTLTIEHVTHKTRFVFMRDGELLKIDKLKVRA